jgi:membrane associated rhomboid family serine protease
MKGNFRRSVLAYVPGYRKNAVVQIILVSTLLYVVLGIIWGLIMIIYPNDVFFNVYFLPNVGLPNKAYILSKFWTLFTFYWFHGDFMQLVTDMLWLYMFGSVVQSFVGYKQVIPLFIYCSIGGGLLYLLSHFIPGGNETVFVVFGKPGNVLLGPGAAVLGMAAAAVTITPKYRFYISEYFSVPLAIVAGIFCLLQVLSTQFSIPLLAFLAGGAGVGFGYVQLLRSGFRPGEWMYDAVTMFENLATPPDARKKTATIVRHPGTQKANTRRGVSSKRVDDILDKINSKGFASLTDEEKNILLQAGKNP